MDIADENILTEAERKVTYDKVQTLYNQLVNEILAQEAKLTAQAVFHEAVNTASAKIISELLNETENICIHELSLVLKKPENYPFVLESVIQASKPVAKYTALESIQKWCIDKSIENGTQAALSVFSSYPIFNKETETLVQTTLNAGLRVFIQQKLETSGKQELNSEEKTELINEFLSTETLKAINSLPKIERTAEQRRKAQLKAEQAITEIAKEANSDIARRPVLDITHQTAASVSRLECTKLILAEAQRRAAKLARLRIEPPPQDMPDIEKLAKCQKEARQIASEVSQELVQELTLPNTVQINEPELLELAMTAAFAVSKEISGVFELTDSSKLDTTSSKNPIMTFSLISLCILGLIWICFICNYETTRTEFQKILPGPLFRVLYPPKQSTNDDPLSEDLDNNVEDEDYTKSNLNNIQNTDLQNNTKGTEPEKTETKPKQLEQEELPEKQEKFQ